MSIKVITFDNRNEWDSVVKSFSRHDVYHLSGYVRAFNLHGDGEPLLFYGESGALRGINVVMKRDIARDDRFAGKIPENTYFDLATPYGYGGWLFEGEGNREEIFSDYNSWCVENGIISEFTRFHPILKNDTDSESIYEVIRLGHTVAIDLDSPENIWARFTSQNRNKIKKAKNFGLECRHGLSQELFSTFKTIYESTMDGDNAIPYYYFKDEFYQSILTDLKDNAEIFYIVDGEKIIAASIMLFENGNMHYHLSGSLYEQRTKAPSNLLLFEAAKWGSGQGFKSLHLGGGLGSKNDNLFEFKKSFYRGEYPTFSIGKRIMDSEKCDYLMSLRPELENTGFFPPYRA